MMQVCAARASSFRQELGAVLSDADFARAIARIRELGWYVKIQATRIRRIGR